VGRTWLDLSPEDRRAVVGQASRDPVQVGHDVAGNEMRGPADAAERRPYDEAMAQLEAIMRESWLSAGRMDLQFAAVADTLRRYLEEAEGIPALKYTTAELLRAFAAAAVSAELRHACGVLLHTADLAKFAGDRPDTEGAERT
jgi:hypothetical protein